MFHLTVLKFTTNINSSSGRVINLENVRFVNSIKNVFVIEFDLKVLHFICENGEYAGKIQIMMREIKNIREFKSQTDEILLDLSEVQ